MVFACLYDGLLMVFESSFSQKEAEPCVLMTDSLLISISPMLSPMPRFFSIEPQQYESVCQYCARVGLEHRAPGRPNPPIPTWLRSEKWTSLIPTGGASPL